MDFDDFSTPMRIVGVQPVSSAFTVVGEYESYHVISDVYILGLIISEVPHPKGTVPPFSLWKATTDLEFIENYHSHYS